MAIWPRWELLECPDGNMAKIGTTRVAQMATWPRWGLPERHMFTTPGWGLPEWPGWLSGHDRNYQSGPDGYMAKMVTTRETQMVTMPG